MTNCWHGCGGIAGDSMKPRPDGKLEIDGAAEDIGAALLALVKETASGRSETSSFTSS